MCDSRNQFRKHVDIKALDVVGEEDSFESIRDAQPLEAGEQIVNLFPGSSASKNTILADYAGNPMNGTHGRTFVGAKVELTTPVIQSEDRAVLDPAAFLNAFQTAILRMKADNSTKELFREPVRNYMNLQNAKVESIVNPTGDGYLHQLHIPTLPDYVPLHSTFFVGANQDFTPTVEFLSGAQFAEEAAYVGAQPGIILDFRLLKPNENQ